MSELPKFDEYKNLEIESQTATDESPSTERLSDPKTPTWLDGLYDTSYSEHPELINELNDQLRANELDDKKVQHAHGADMVLDHILNAVHAAETPQHERELLKLRRKAYEFVETAKTAGETGKLNDIAWSMVDEKYFNSNTASLMRKLLEKNRDDRSPAALQAFNGAYHLLGVMMAIGEKEQAQQSEND